ncbi:hypothetical protein Clacol_007996 [Clathrus columnatus]|uniref:Uncharacterized protein n=1 Tax=Clathrus columnatus TaxID=1419009 RepID=A0AAV5AHB5_9AGAM|nr:hypothetical protein Clacol_007996 [Clathrus columnatus]
MDLRRWNTRKATPMVSDLHLPTLSLPPQDEPAQTPRSVLRRWHESLVAEMADGSYISNSNTGEPLTDINDLQNNGDSSENPYDNVDPVTAIRLRRLVSLVLDS